LNPEVLSEIVLEGLEFYAHHGVFSEEQSLGNRFQVDLKLEADIHEAGQSDQINQTIDYVKVYTLISKQMMVKFKLLETIGQRIIQDLLLQFPQIKKVEVTVSKFNPPISGLCKRVAVTSRWKSDY
jgi:dihydroneopterin aldolase